MEQRRGRESAELGIGMPRLLFCSYHCYLDPSSGAALATRGLLELLAARGWACGAFCGPQLDFEQPPPLEELLRSQGLSFTTREARANGESFRLMHGVAHNVPVSLFSECGTTPGNLLTEARAAAFLMLLEGVFDRFQPDVLVLYGGHSIARAIGERARKRGVAVAFALHNLAYQNNGAFEGVDAVFVPSQFAADHYRQHLGLECEVLPSVWDWGKMRCERVEGRYATFVNPQPEKGVFWFARLAAELGRRRPDVPLLVVEGRGGTDWLSRTAVDFGGLTNLHRMANTPDPRDFYRVSRAVVMPSLCQETLGRVAVEALINDIPVLASNRGALPETLRGAGFLFDIPAQYTPQSREAPTAAEVEPWFTAIERLWDDESFYELQRQLCRQTAESYLPERVLPRYEAFFHKLAQNRSH